MAFAAKFRSKEKIITAVQITDDWFDLPHPSRLHIPGLVYDPVNRVVLIPTLEGTMTGQIGDWIIEGIVGEIYPCKPDVFERTYEAVEAK